LPPPHPGPHHLSIPHCPSLLTPVSAPGLQNTPKQTPKNPSPKQPNSKSSSTSPISVPMANTPPPPSNKTSSKYTKARQLVFPCSVTVLPSCCMRCVLIDLRLDVRVRKVMFSEKLRMICLHKVGYLSLLCLFVFFCFVC